jgi:hypothetical protein
MNEMLDASLNEKYLILEKLCKNYAILLIKYKLIKLKV